MKKLVRLVLAFLLAAVPRFAHAAHFDVIHVADMDVTLCGNGCGITLAGSDYMCVVNMGSTNIDAPELFSASYSVVSSTPAISLICFVNNPGQPVAPILPHEAVGSMGVLGGNFTSLLTPQETFRNTMPLQVFAFQIQRVSAYVGPVDFDVTMRMGAEDAHFRIHATIHDGPHAISFGNPGRVSSSTPPVAVRRTSWGQLKLAYR